MFLLMLLLNYYSVEKQGGKKGLIWPVDPSNFEIIFISLTKTIVV